MQLRKAKFIVPDWLYWKNIGFTAGEEIDVTVHGFFQSQDGDGAEPVAIVELEDGRIFEVTPSKLIMRDKPSDSQQDKMLMAINELVSALIDGSCKIRVI